MGSDEKKKTSMDTWNKRQQTVKTNLYGIIQLQSYTKAIENNMKDVGIGTEMLYNRPDFKE